MDNNRTRLLRVMDIMRGTDEENPITVNRIVEKLSSFGIKAERKAVNRDISALIDYGWDILLHEDNKKGFYLASREFEDWELKVLTDAVMGASFLTKKNSEALAKKLRSFAGTDTAKALRIVTPVESDVKTGDVTTKNNIDILFRAIKLSKKVRFKYIYTGPDMEKHFKYLDNPRDVSPYVLLWRQDKYYLIGNFGAEKPLSYYRLDRIRALSITEEPVFPLKSLVGPNPDMFISDFVSKNIYNKSGKYINVKLRAANEMVDTLIDFFGPDIKIAKDSENTFTTRIKVSESEGFYQWLLHYGEKIQVLEPESVRNKTIDIINKLLNNYK
ncbi:MAG: WYL domain-containing protein [Clostridia bacterium]|nr:WYL domain-containing protein [Clostridia bacterium]